VKRVVGLLVGIALLLLPTYGFAQTEQESSSGLQIAPTRSELTINPGKSETITLSIKNITGGEITAKAEVNDFRPDNDTGTPQLLTNEREPLSTSIKRFLPPITDLSLAVGETKKVAVTVSVPTDQPPGGYYGVLRFKAFPKNANDDAGQHVFSLTASVGHIILVQVPGQITEKLEAVSLSAEYHKNPSNFFLHPPDSMRLEVKNVGNSFIKPFGTVTIKNSKGKEVYSYEVNDSDPRGNVLPKSNRAFHNDIKNISNFGRYSAVASVSYGNGGDVLSLKTSFWVVPLWLLVVLALVLLLLVLAITLLVRRLRRHRPRYHKGQ
jgi:hypothetical protein